MLFVDDREHAAQEYVRRLAELEVPASVKRLDVSDFQFKDWEDSLVLVSRKAGDLMASIYSKHLNEEIDKCIRAVASYGRGSVWFLMDWHSAGGSRDYKQSLFDSTVISLQLSGVRFLWTLDTPRTLATLYKRAQVGWPITLGRALKSPTVTPWQRDQRVPRLMALWPHLSERIAVQLLRKYGTIYEVLRAVETRKLGDRENVPGLGKKSLDNIRAVIGG